MNVTGHRLSGHIFDAYLSKLSKNDKANMFNKYILRDIFVFVVSPKYGPRSTFAIVFVLLPSFCVGQRSYCVALFWKSIACARASHRLDKYIRS